MDKRQPEEPQQNREGLTFEEWLRAAYPHRAKSLWDGAIRRWEVTSSNLAIYFGVREEWNAWLRGEDPTDHRAEWEAA